jgi:uncharacterized phage-associated protein
METHSENSDIPKYKPSRGSKTYSTFHEIGSEDHDSVSSGIWETEEKRMYSFTPTSRTTAFDVAAYILEKQGEMTTMKLHKLVYYSQAWSLVWDETPLFVEKIEAWANGPVVRELFAYHRGHYSLSKISLGNSSVLTTQQKETVDSILEFYGNKSSQWLVELSHLEEPWKKARRGLSSSERGNREITIDSIAEYYSSL